MLRKSATGSWRATGDGWLATVCICVCASMCHAGGGAMQAKQRAHTAHAQAGSAHRLHEPLELASQGGDAGLGGASGQEVVDQARPAWRQVWGRSAQAVERGGPARRRSAPVRRMRGPPARARAHHPRGPVSYCSHSHSLPLVPVLLAGRAGRYCQVGHALLHLQQARGQHDAAPHQRPALQGGSVAGRHAQTLGLQQRTADPRMQQPAARSQGSAARLAAVVRSAQAAAPGCRPATARALA